LLKLASHFYRIQNFLKSLARMAESGQLKIGIGIIGAKDSLKF
jgi:hypothetical protein